MRTVVFTLLGACLVTSPAMGAQQLDLSQSRMVDLTHALNARTLYWPTSPTTFKLDQLSYGPTPGGWFYSAYAFSAPEHGGTHLDAPIHFGEAHLTVDRIPLEKLIAPAVVIDAGSIVLLRTGWSARWPERKAYLGDDTPNDASNLHFPSFGVEAARLLVQERRVAALGADVASIDYGPSKDFMVHRIAAAADVPGLENLTNLNLLPPTGAIVIALPMKIEGGSGGPVRVVALFPKQ
jgi:kynurenine formamidase